MSHHVGGIVLAVLWTLGLGSLPFAHRYQQWRARRQQQVAEVNAPLAQPVARTQPRPINRAERLKRLDMIWHHTQQRFINQEVGMWELELADLQPLADGLLDDDAEAQR